MTYKSLMVHLELNGDNDGVLHITADLAVRFGARVIGIAACKPIQVLYGDGITSGDVIAQDRQEIARELAATEAQFRAALEGRVADVQWRGGIVYGALADFIADEARAADLIITGKELPKQMFDDTRGVHMGDLVMRAGRPVLLVPRGVTALTMRHVVVGWKETREARRAVADAVPLLREAGQVAVLQVAAQARLRQAADHVADVAAWLAAHGVQAVPQTLTLTGGEAQSIHETLVGRKCDLFVAGGYGHARFNEWVFGGVTHDLLLDCEFCVLISH